MEKKQTDSVQNRFTAYLMAAVANKRISYIVVLQIRCTSSMQIRCA